MAIPVIMIVLVLLTAAGVTLGGLRGEKRAAARARAADDQSSLLREIGGPRLGDVFTARSLPVLHKVGQLRGSAGRCRDRAQQRQASAAAWWREIWRGKTSKTAVLLVVFGCVVFALVVPANVALSTRVFTALSGDPRLALRYALLLTIACAVAGVASATLLGIHQVPAVMKMRTPVRRGLGLLVMATPLVIGGALVTVATTRSGQQLDPQVAQANLDLQAAKEVGDKPTITYREAHLDQLTKRQRQAADVDKLASIITPLLESISAIAVVYGLEVALVGVVRADAWRLERKAERDDRKAQHLEEQHQQQWVPLLVDAGLPADAYRALAAPAPPATGGAGLPPGTIPGQIIPARERDGTDNDTPFMPSTEREQGNDLPDVPLPLPDPKPPVVPPTNGPAQTETGATPAAVPAPFIPNPGSAPAAEVNEDDVI